jgi:hypothetical protein
MMGKKTRSAELAAFQHLIQKYTIVFKRQGNPEKNIQGCAHFSAVELLLSRGQ